MPKELRAHNACEDHGRPMLVIHGCSDVVVPTADINAFMQANPLADLVRIPGAGHDFEDEGQLEAVVETAEAWLFEPREKASR